MQNPRCHGGFAVPYEGIRVLKVYAYKQQNMYISYAYILQSHTD